MTLKTIEDLSLFLGGIVRSSDPLRVDLMDGTTLDFKYTVNGEFMVLFSNGSVWNLEFDLGSAIEKRILKLYGKLSQD